MFFGGNFHELEFTGSSTGSDPFDISYSSVDSDNARLLYFDFNLLKIFETYSDFYCAFMTFSIKN